MADKMGATIERSGLTSRGFVCSRARSLVPWLVLLVIGGLAPGLAAAQGTAQRPPQPPQPRTSGIELSPEISANRDSLLSEIQVYTRMIRGLRDSLAGDETGLSLSEAQREQLEGNIQEITGVIERISKEMSRMEFQIRDNRISLVNEAGEGIIINVPEDLDVRVSQGIEAITKAILSEMPDSVNFDRSRRWDWNRFKPEPPAPARRVINGNIVKVWNDVEIAANEDVRGNVVAVFGSADVDGRVEGTVVTVFGGLRLGESAEVTGTVVAIGGDLEQSPGAVVEDVVSINPLQQGQGNGWRSLLRHDGLSFLISQGAFLLMVLLAVVAVVATPGHRFENITNTLLGARGASLGTGLLAALAGHALAAVLMAVLVLTVIGVPVALLVGLGLGMVIVVAVAVSGAVVGARLCTRIGGGCPAPWLVVVVGMTALHLVSFLGALLGVMGQPHALATALVGLGWAIKLAAYLFGLGALVNSRFGSKSLVG